MRLIAFAALATLASPAAAQVGRVDDVHVENRIAIQQDIARQQALAADRQTFALGLRARTRAQLDTLRTGQILAQSRAEPLPPVPLDPRMSADAEAIATAQDRLLAASNARILAVKPASER